MSECAFKGCDKPARNLGLCGAHYQQAHKGQELRPVRSYKRYPVPAPGKKICNACERIKDIGEFYRKSPNGGVFACCKVCMIKTASEAQRQRKEARNGS